MGPLWDPLRRIGMDVGEPIGPTFLCLADESSSQVAAHVMGRLVWIGALMGQVVSSASTSSDGFIANPHHTVGSLFDRYNTGDIKVSTA